MLLLESQKAKASHTDQLTDQLMDTRMVNADDMSKLPVFPFDAFNHEDDNVINCKIGRRPCLLINK